MGLAAGCSSGSLTIALALPLLHICFGNVAVHLAAVAGLVTAVAGIESHAFALILVSCCLLKLMPAVQKHQS